MINRISLVGVHFLFPRSLYTSAVKSTGRSAGMILSRISVCKFRNTSPTLKLSAVCTLTEVAINAPTTLSPMINAASVNLEIVTKRGGEIYEKCQKKNEVQSFPLANRYDEPLNARNVAAMAVAFR